MKQIVNISTIENNKVYNLFYTHMAYMNILHYFMNNKITNETLFDRKWNEAIKIELELDEEKRKVEKKYKPEGEWDRFEFDFDKCQVVFIKNE